jgi:cytochrome P450
MLPIAFDPPEHTRYRHLLYADHFSRRRIELKESEIRALAAELVDAVAGKGECEFVEAVAVPLPAQVFLAMFGLPHVDRDKLIAWKNRILGNSAGTGATEAAPQATAEAAAELLEYLIGHIARRRAEPDDSDLLGRLLADPSDERMSDHELLGLSFQFVLAGLDTVTSALANAMTILASRPDLRQRIVDDPGIIPAAIEELLRIDGPVVTLPRIATQDVELDGMKVAEGCPVHVALAVANRDPAEYANPDAIDFDRGEAHLAFGIGPHFCLGTHLARLEMRVVLEEWHRRIPTYALTNGAEPAARWPAGLIGVTSVPLSYP